MAVLITFEDSGSYAPVRLSNIPIILGRSSKAGLQLNDGMCSGQHISIQLAVDGSVVVNDLGSTNGTYINETLVSMSSKLFIGDVVRIGETKFSIDATALTAKEKAHLVSNSNKTSFTSIGLPRDSAKAQIAAKNARRVAMGLKVNDSDEEVASDDEDLSIIINEAKLDETQDESFNTPEAEDAEPIIDFEEKPQETKLAEVTNSERDEALFELGESSGKTKIIQLDKLKSAKSKQSSKKSTKVNKKKKVQHERPAGLMSKVRSLFGKDD